MEEIATPAHSALFRAAQVWAWMICVLGSSGNLFTLATGVHQLASSSTGNQKSFGRDGRRRLVPPAITLQADTLLLLHLSLCDLLYCSVNLPIIAMNYDHALSDTPTSIPSEQFCTATVVFRYLNALIEWMTLGLLAVERCLDMGRIRSDRIFTPLKTCSLLVCCWLTALLPQVISILNGDVYGFDNTTYKCDMSDDSSGKRFFYIVETPLPCIFMITGVASIIYQVWNNKRRLIATHMSQELVAKRSRSAWRSTALVLCLLTLFLLCVIPNAVYNIVIISGTADNVPVALATFMIYWIQYGANFILYAAGNRNFRQAYIQFLQAMADALCCCCRLQTPCCHTRPPSPPHYNAAQSGGVSFLSIPDLEVKDMSEATLITPEFCEDTWNTSSGKLMSCLTVGNLKTSSSFSSSSSSSSSISLSTTSFSSSASWDSSSTLVTCTSLSSSF